MNSNKYLWLFEVILIILLISNACKKSEEEIEKIFLKDAIDKITIDGVVKWIIILPGLGCDGCIQEGEAFMKKYIENRDILFVLTNISSLKILEQKIDIRIKSHNNIFIDKENEFIVPTDNRIYPCIIQIKNTKITSHEFQCPKNAMAFNKLKTL
jgi:hypothetical protein